MVDLQQALGAVIREERRIRRLTLRHLAASAAVSTVYLGEIERGKKYPSALVLERLCGALELSVSDVLERVAYELRGEQQVMSAIGFRMPDRTAEAAGTPALVMLVA